MSAHTPGPWGLAKRAGGIAIEHKEEKSYGWLQHEVALAYPLSMPDKATGEANARLIAAAPDLLAALEELAFRAERHSMNADEARAAIAKAKGA